MRVGRKRDVEMIRSRQGHDVLQIFFSKLMAGARSRRRSGSRDGLRHDFVDKNLEIYIFLDGGLCESIIVETIEEVINGY